MVLQHTKHTSVGKVPATKNRGGRDPLEAVSPVVWVCVLRREAVSLPTGDSIPGRWSLVKCRAGRVRYLILLRLRRVARDVSLTTE